MRSGGVGKILGDRGYLGGKSSSEGRCGKVSNDYLADVGPYLRQQIFLLGNEKIHVSHGMAAQFLAHDFQTATVVFGSSWETIFMIELREFCVDALVNTKLSGAISDQLYSGLNELFQLFYRGVVFGHFESEVVFREEKRRNFVLGESVMYCRRRDEANWFRLSHAYSA